jgi:hypothetical protein
MSDFLISIEIKQLAAQLGLDLKLLMHEVYWALGEERINKVTPSYDEFQNWVRQKNGLLLFWQFANNKLGVELTPEEAQDIWECIELTLNARKRCSFAFQDYLVMAMRSDAKCEFCGKRPPEVALEIDHILPVSKGGTNNIINLRFLCQHHNRSRSNRFRWADVWRRAT